MRLFFTVSFLIFFAFSQAQLNQPETRKDFLLQGRVKFIEENYISKKKKNRETTTMEFSSKGKILKKEEISTRRKVSTIFSYNSQNRQEKVWFRNFDKNRLVTESIMTFRYSNDSVFISTDITDDGKKSNKSFTAVLKDDLLIKYFGEKNGESRVTEFVYDDHGNVISQTNFKKGEISKKYEFTYNYDENGNLLKQTDVNENRTIEFFPNGLRKLFNEYTYEYFYDSTGNWIRKIVFENGKKYSESSRNITYFE
jgi:YD repeat-containing protein